MPSKKRIASKCDESIPLAGKLRILEEMLEELEKLRKAPFSLEDKEAAIFRQKMNALVADAQEMDRLIRISQNPSKDIPSGEEQELQEKIQGTVNRLMDANRSLVASVKAQQAILGDKIARLRENKDLLQSYRPDLHTEPTLIDSDA